MRPSWLSETERGEDVEIADSSRKIATTAEQLREHLHEQEGQQSDPAALEAHARERIGGQRTEEHSAAAAVKCR